MVRINLEWRRRTWMLCGIVLSAAPAVGCSSPAPPLAPPAGVSGHRLGPGDQVELFVFQHDELFGTYLIDDEGYLTLPRIGEILVDGLTARQLENEIYIRYPFGPDLRYPRVTVEVLNYRGPIYIVGEVRNPGSFHYVSGMTVINAVDLAGGFTLRPEQYEIIITRGDSDGPRERARPDTEVLPGDIVEVAARFL